VEHRLATVVLLSKLAAHVVALRSPELAALPEAERLAAVGPTPSPALALAVGAGLSDGAVARLGACFAPLLARLEAEQLAAEARVGLGRVLALHRGSSTLYQIC
jgi:hypothetical protein